MYQLFKPFYRTEEILTALRPIFEGGWTGNGQQVIALEKNFSDYINISDIHAVNNGTSALHLAVKLLKDKYGWEEDKSEVITTANTFCSTPHSILYERLIPVFADIDMDSGNLSPEDILKKMTPNTKAVLFVTMGGNSANYKEVVQLCKENNLKLIVDNAHSAGSFLNGEAIGKEADAVAWSMHSVKPLPSSDGGFIVFPQHPDLNILVRELTWLGINKTTFDRTLSSGAYKFKYNVPSLGFKYHYNDVNATVALVSLKYLEKDNAYRRHIASCYIRNLKNCPQIKIITHENKCETSQHLFQIMLEKRDETLLLLNQSNIFPGAHYIDNTSYPMYASQKANVPNSVLWGEKILSLPIGMHITKKDADFISKELLKLVQK